MKCQGGYNVVLAGRPTAAVTTPAEPDVLHLPLWSRRLTFSDLSVEDGRRVRAGEVLATDPDHYSAPLLAPRGGTVRLDQAERHVTLVDLDAEPPPGDASAAADKGRKLLNLGAWQFFIDAHTGTLPDPQVAPTAIIVSTILLEPFGARGDAQLKDRLEDFERGLVHLQSMLEYQPIYLLLPDISTAFAQEVHQSLLGHAWINLIQIPLRCGCDDFAVVARRLGHRLSAGEVIWCLRTEGVFAVDRALTTGRPCLTRTLALGGPCVTAPTHVELPVGYPLTKLLADRLSENGPVRVINGGVLTGRKIGQEQQGVDAECDGLTVVPEAVGKDVLGWIRPGTDRRSYSRCFASVLRPNGPTETMTTATRGERRACISCNFCEEVCPANIMPHLIHKYLHQDMLEEVEAVGVDLCVECGLCSYVCPSKIELRQQFIEAKEVVRQELHTEEVEA